MSTITDSAHCQTSIGDAKTNWVQFNRHSTSMCVMKSISSSSVTVQIRNQSFALKFACYLLIWMPYLRTVRCVLHCTVHAINSINLTIIGLIPSDALLVPSVRESTDLINPNNWLGDFFSLCHANVLHLIMRTLYNTVHPIIRANTR